MKSRYKIPQLVLILFVSALFLLIPILILTKPNHLFRKDFIVLLLPVLSLLLVYFYFRKAPRILFDDDFITARYFFSSDTYSWTSITDIYLSKKDFNMMQPMEATSILFDNGRKLNLWQDVYRNCAEMRRFIFKRESDKIRDSKPTLISGNLRAILRRRYAGNVYTSFNSLFIVGVAVFSWVISKSIDHLAVRLCFVIGFTLLFFFGYGSQMNYFIIDEGCLVIRNHYFPWVNKTIRLTDIIEADVETPNKRSTSLRILTTELESFLYGGGSLRKKNWDELQLDFTSIGIPFRQD